MALYSCPKCGMSVGTMTCGTCGKELVHDTLQLDGGASVDIAKCPRRARQGQVAAMLRRGHELQRVGTCVPHECS